jgi:predicted PurR-regulated permease PerM
MWNTQIYKDFSLCLSMLTEKIFKDILTTILIIGLFILAFFILKPVAMSIIFGILLAYIFFPIYKRVLVKIKRENLSAFLVCILLLLIVLIPVVLILTSIINQAVDVYLSLQNLDLAFTLKQTFPSFFSSELSSNLASSLNGFVSTTISYIISKFSGFILNIPVIMLQFFVVVFVFFFGLRDGKKAVEYVRSLSPFEKEIAERFFRQFKDITNSVLLGQVVVGIFQGIIAGIGYFIFGVPYVLFLTLLTMFIGIIPLIGPWLVWIPIDIYLFISGRTGAGLGLLIYGLIAISWLDTLIRPIIVSKRTEINSAIVIIGMIGGLFVFGVLGLILGPLILGYVLLVIDIYRKSKKSIFFKEIKQKPAKPKEDKFKKFSKLIKKDFAQKNLIGLDFSLDKKED